MLPYTNVALFIPSLVQFSRENILVRVYVIIC